MTSRIEWVRESCRLLGAIGDEFERTRPFAGLTVGTGIHLEPKTVALLLTLQRGGAASSRPATSTRRSRTAVDYLRAHGVDVIGGPTTDDPPSTPRTSRGARTLSRSSSSTTAATSSSRYLERPYDGLRGGTEETTSGRARLAPLARAPRRARAGDQRQPDQAVRREPRTRSARACSSRSCASRTASPTAGAWRSSATAHAGEASPQYFRATHALVVGRRDRPGRAARGAPRRLRRARDATRRSRAPTSSSRSPARADVITGRRPRRCSATARSCCNAGHFPWEIDVAGIEADPRVLEPRDSDEGITTLRLARRPRASTC